MRNEIKFLVILLLAFSINIKAQIPAGYYDSATGTGQVLKTQLFNIIKDPSVTSYDGLWTAFKTTDRDNYYENDQTVMDMYSENPNGADPYTYEYTSDQCGSYSDEGSCYNREHSFPKSWFGEASPMYSDIVHLLPTDGYVNGKRSNYPFGNVASASWTSQNGSKLGSCSSASYSGTVFEPIDEFKGDFARIYFYMATCYEDKIASWSSSCLAGNSFPCYEPWFLETMLAWHAQDPVSQKEIDRNDGIYSTQGNRNPYVDHPEWVECVWNGNCVGTVQNPTNLTATAFSNSQINLSWALNGDNNNVVLAYSTTNTFGTPTGTYTAGQTITGGGEVLYVGNSTTFNHTSLTNQIYYYKIWSINSSDEYSSGITGQASPLTQEPDNYPTNFVVSNVTSNSITLTWIDATGTNLPDAYLIKASTNAGSIINPTDGTPETDATFVKNINQGIQTVTFEGLSESTQYFFKIYSYANSASNIDYKIEGTVPETDGTTTVNTAASIVITEIAGKGYDTDFNNEYIEITNTGCSNVDLTDYILEYYEGSVEATLNLTGIINAGASYVIAVRTTYTAAISPDFIPSVSFNINNPCYVILKEGTDIIDQAGNTTDKFDAANNYIFTDCSNDNEATANWTNLSTGNGTPGVNDCPITAPSDVTSLNSNCSSFTSDISWTNSTCFDEVILVVSENPITGIPTGIYTANSASYTDSANPDFPNGGKIVYNGTANVQTVTDLTEETQYYFKVFVRKQSLWSLGLETNCTTQATYIENINDNIKIYPNPSNSGVFTIKTNSTKQKIEVYNLNGQIVKSITSNKNFTNVDLAEFSKGIYFVKIKNNVLTSWAKIIIE